MDVCALAIAHVYSVFFSVQVCVNFITKIEVVFKALTNTKTQNLSEMNTREMTHKWLRCLILFHDKIYSCI